MEGRWKVLDMGDLDRHATPNPHLAGPGGPRGLVSHASGVARIFLYAAAALGVRISKPCLACYSLKRGAQKNETMADNLVLPHSTSIHVLRVSHACLYAAWPPRAFLNVGSGRHLKFRSSFNF